MSWWLSAFVLLAGCSLTVDFDSVRPGNGSATVLCTDDAPDGTLDGDEECDDGNTDDDDACLSSCRLATCGDGFVRKFIETCDSDADDCFDCVACPSGAAATAMQDGRCYAYYEGPQKWDDSRRSCFGQDSDLATLSGEPSVADPVLSALSDDLGGPLGDTYFGLVYLSVSYFVSGDPDPGATNFEAAQSFDDVADTVGAFRGAGGQWFLNDENVSHDRLCMRSPPVGTRDEVTGHYYLMQRKTLTEFGFGVQSAAEDACSLRGAHLLTITSAEELGFINRTFPGAVRFWVGLKDYDSDGDLEWVTGADFDPALIPGGAELDPNRCVAFDAGSLENVDCNNNSPQSMCEWD